MKASSAFPSTSVGLSSAQACRVRGFSVLSNQAQVTSQLLDLGDRSLWPAYCPRSMHLSASSAQLGPSWSTPGIRKDCARV